ncbi:MAG TPA: nuclear transport factor 2 family protein, partial [Anaerolineales bacterium]|nr:nuclear transport factor 2 family protein [Anaerolineales bacterium]
MGDIESIIVGMEKAALERWGKGDPSGFLEISAPDVVYFDPYIPRRIDGLAALKEYYQALWGQIHIDRFELLKPSVQVDGDLAVLTFNYVSYQGDEPDRWNCTEVYRRSAAGQWQIIQSHWSYTEVFKYKLEVR